jgi:hypothetical protein
MTDPAEVELPEPELLGTELSGHVLECYGYTAEQMRAAVLQEREARAAKWERAHGFDKYGVANFIRTGALRAQKEPT